MGLDSYIWSCMTLTLSGTLYKQGIFAAEMWLSHTSGSSILRKEHTAASFKVAGITLFWKGAFTTSWTNPINPISYNARWARLGDTCGRLNISSDVSTLLDSSNYNWSDITWLDSALDTSTCRALTMVSSLVQLLMTQPSKSSKVSRPISYVGDPTSSFATQKCSEGQLFDNAEVREK